MDTELQVNAQLQETWIRFRPKDLKVLPVVQRRILKLNKALEAAENKLKIHLKQPQWNFVERKNQKHEMRYKNRFNSDATGSTSWQKRIA